MLNKNTMRGLNRKLGLGNCSYENILWNIEWMLKIIGLTVRNTPQGFFTVLKYIITFFMQFYTYQVGCVFYYMYIVMPSGKSILQNIEFAMVHNISVLNIGRMVWLKILRTGIAEMINLGFELDKSINHNQQWKEAILTKMRPVKIRCIVLWLTWAISTMEHLIKPAFLAAREFPDQYVVYPSLIPATETPNYQIGYTLQVLSTFTMFCASTGYLLLFVATSGHAASHLRVLAEQLHLLNKDFEKSHFKTSPKIRRDFDQRLKFIIFMQNEVKKFVKKSSDTFNGIVGFDFLILGGLLSALMLQSDSWLYILRYLPNFSLPVIMITLYCVLGQGVIEASGQFENMLYDFNWDDLDVKRRRILLLIAMNAKDPLVFKCLYVEPLAHKLQMSIIKIIYSVYTALNSARNYI